MYYSTSLFSANMYICGFIGVILNTVLLYCIRYKSPVELGEMRYFLANMAISDIIIAISGLLLQTSLTYHDAYSVVKALGPIKYWGIPKAIYLHQIWLSAFIHSTVSMPFGFYFRQKSVCRTTASGPVLSARQFLLAMTIFAAISLGFGLIWPILMEICSQELLERLNGSFPELTCDLVAVYELKIPGLDLFDQSDHQSDQNSAGNPKQLAFFWWNMAFNFTIATCYAAIAIYLSKIYKFLKMHRKSMTSETHSKLAAFLKVNVYQSLFPIFTLILPSTFNLIGVFYTSYDFDGSAFLVYGSVAYLPVFDAIFPLYFIRKYKVFLISKIKQIARLCFGAKNLPDTTATTATMSRCRTAWK